MSGVFISYRRDDSAGHAGRLFDRLAGHFGSHRVFMDVDTIKPGEDFAGVIDEHIARCDVLLALIGNDWLSSSHDSGQRRLDDPEDFVRLEIVSALNRGIVVIPVLVENIPMPAAKILPSALQRLARLQALGLANARFQDDVEKLIETIERYLVSPITPTLSGNSRLRRAGAISAVVFGLGLLLGLLWVNKPGTSPPAASLDLSGKWIAQVLVKDDRHYTLVLELEMTGNRILGGCNIRRAAAAFGRGA